MKKYCFFILLMMLFSCDKVAMEETSETSETSDYEYLLEIYESQNVSTDDVPVDGVFTFISLLTD